MKGAQYRWNGLYLKIGVKNRVFKFVNECWIKHEMPPEELLDKAEKEARKRSDPENRHVDYDFDAMP